MSQRKFEVLDICIQPGKAKRGVKLFGSSVMAKNPKRAGVKVFNKICNKNKKKDCSLKISIKEEGKDTKHTYKITRKYEPKEVVIQGKSVVFKYNYTVKSV